LNIYCENRVIWARICLLCNDLEGVNLPLGMHDLGMMDAYNKIHVGYTMHVEWGMRGLKPKWKRLMKCFDSTQKKIVMYSKL